MNKFLTAVALIIVIAGLTASAALLILPLAVVILSAAVMSRLFDNGPEPAFAG